MQRIPMGIAKSNKLLYVKYHNMSDGINEHQK